MKKRHFNDPPTIREMLDHIEETRTCDAPCLLAMLRLAVNTLNWYANGQGPETRLNDNGDLATTVLGNIERGLWATAPQELWYEKPEADDDHHTMMNSSRIQQSLYGGKRPTPRTDKAAQSADFPLESLKESKQLEIELEEKRIALAAMGSIAESTQLRVSELEDALDLNRDEFARIHAIASGGELLSEEAREVKGICERARERTWQLVPMIEQLEAANARIQTLDDSLSALIYTAERAAELINSASDRYDIDVAIESAKEILKK